MCLSRVQAPAQQGLQQEALRLAPLPEDLLVGIFREARGMRAVVVAAGRRKLYLMNDLMGQLINALCLQPRKD